MKLHKLANDICGRDKRWMERQKTSRAKYGVSQRDSWSLDSYIGTVIANGCIMLRDRQFGYPCELREEILGGTADDALSLWSAILTAIIDGFNVVSDHWSLCETLDYMEESKVVLAFSLLVEYFPCLWD